MGLGGLTNNIYKKTALAIGALGMMASASGAIIDGHFSTDYVGEMEDGTHRWNTTVVNTTESDSSDYSAYKLKFPVTIDDNDLPSGDKISWEVKQDQYENNADEPLDNYFNISTDISGEYLVPGEHEDAYEAITQSQ